MAYNLGADINGPGDDGSEDDSPGEDEEDDNAMVACWCSDFRVVAGLGPRSG